MTRPKILVIEDDENICDLLKIYLQKDYRLFFARDGSQGVSAFRAVKPDLVILDLMLPLINGWEVCRLIRQESGVPIIMLTARDAVEDRVQGLDLGADDYVVKPFDPRELTARIRARLRKAGAAELLVAGNLTLDMKTYRVTCGGRPVELTPKEIRLLHFFLVNRNAVLTREQILEKVWGYDYAGGTRTVDMHVKKLRDKLKGGSGWQIKTIYGVGYKFEVTGDV
ncbi:response regulator transcription factor [Desulfovirgula thermocuniculi]|uniref:response regulator transcription factor n=1 Tax=Desulfovirgula thermocuniculi TaxID=348842 RepID=UPI0003FE5F22|nr:response regulator transcription factor [Desulfovirgula thermocuniculi]